MALMPLETLGTKTRFPGSDPRKVATSALASSTKALAFPPLNHWSGLDSISASRACLNRAK